MSNKIEEAWKAAQFNRLNDLENLVPSPVNANASTYSQENHVHTLLMSAAAHGSTECAKYLIEKGANVNLKNFAGYTALHWAAFTGRTETLPLLLEKGAEIDSRTEDGRTPLHIAAFRGHLEFVEALLRREKAHADIDAVSCNGWNALHYSVLSNQQAVAKFLIQQGIDYQSLDSEGKSIQEIATNLKRTWMISLIPSE